MKTLTIFFILILPTGLLTGCKREPTAKYIPIDPLTAGLETAQAYIKEGDPHNAIRTLEELNRHYPNNTDILEALAFAHSGQKDYAEAAFYFEEVVKLNPEYTHFLLYSAQAYAEEKDWEAAKNCYMRYLQVYPEDGQTWKLLAKAYGALNLSDEALGAYMQALHEDKGTPSALESIAIGKLYLKKKDYDQANDWYEIALYQAESRPFALLGQAELYYKSQHPEVALKKLSLLEEEYPDFKNLNPVIALKRELQRWQEEQIAAQKNKLLIVHSRPPANNLSSSTLALNSKPSASISKNNNQNSNINLGAIPTIHTVLSSSISTSSNLDLPTVASLFQEENPLKKEKIDNGKEKPFSSSENNVAPTSLANSTIAQLTLEADELMKSDQVDAALQLYWQTIQYSPQQATGWLKVSQAYERKGDFKTAKTTALEALRIDPHSAMVTLHYLDIIKHLDLNNVFQEFQKAKEHFPDSADITIAYARTFIEEQNNTRNALSICQEFLQKYPNSPDRKKIEQELKRIVELGKER